MGIMNVIGGAFTSPAMLTIFLRTPMWVTPLYFVLILAPLFSLVVPKFLRSTKTAEDPVGSLERVCVRKGLRYSVSSI